MTAIQVAVADTMQILKYKQIAWKIESFFHHLQRKWMLSIKFSYETSESFTKKKLKN